MKKLEIAELYELYNNLLTETKKSILADYYLYDLSLGEIAESRQISRQSVNDALKKGVKQLEFYESKLRLKERNKKLIGIVEIVKGLDTQVASELQKIIED